jgi:hypothetical protein
MNKAAPGGRFRVIGEDHFEQPETQEFIEGDFATLEEAKRHCEAELQPLTSFVVYDDRGRVVADYPAPDDEEE